MSKKKKIFKPLTDFLFELGMLKKISHCGVKFAGIRHPDTLAEHTLRAAQIGFVLAEMEKADPFKVTAMCLFHDIGEIRIGDMHRIAQRYIQSREAEKRAVAEQTKHLPPRISGQIKKCWDEFHSQKTAESKIARDADLLETILQAKEYLDCGYKTARRWLANSSKFLRTGSAKKIYEEIKKSGFADWWDDLNRV